MPLGSVTEQDCDVRVVAATNRDLSQAVSAGTFREDLYYRLHVVPVRMPPLRDRPEDIPPLADLFLRQAAQQQGMGRVQLDSDAVRVLRNHPWPGNVRELANVMTGAALIARDGRVGPEELAAVLPEHASQLPPRASTPPPSGPAEPPVSMFEGGDGLLTMREAREVCDRAYLREVLRRCKGNVSRAARLAERNRTDFHDLLRRHDIDASRFRE